MRAHLVARVVVVVTFVALFSSSVRAEPEVDDTALLDNLPSSAAAPAESPLVPPSSLSGKIRLRSGNTNTSVALASNKGKTPLLFVRAALFKKHARAWGYRGKQLPPAVVVVRSSKYNMIPPEAVGHSYVLLRNAKKWPRITENLNPVTRRQVVLNSKKRRRVILHRSRHNRFEAFAILPKGYYNVLPARVLSDVAAGRARVVPTLTSVTSRAKAHRRPSSTQRKSTGAPQKNKRARSSNNSQLRAKPATRNQRHRHHHRRPANKQVRPARPDHRKRHRPVTAGQPAKTTKKKKKQQVKESVGQEDAANEDLDSLVVF